MVLMMLAPRAAVSLEREDVLLIGDSVTAGVWFLSLSQRSAEQSWAGQLVQRLGLAVDDFRLDGWYPLDHKSLTEDGLGWLSLRYPWQALPVLFPQGSKFAANDERVVLAVPGQMVQELLTQDSDHKGRGSAGWTFANLLLPPGLSVIETVEQWNKRPRWIVLFIGANDALASLGMVGRSLSPSPAAFEASYDELVRRLRARLRNPHEEADHLLVLTLPDVTRLPLLQPVGEARDERGDPLPPGSKALAFLVPFRDRYRDEEVWTRAERRELRERVEDYNAAIERVAARQGATVVDMRELFEELLQDDEFGQVDSPHFSPDLHHPSHLTHAKIADRVWRAMAELSRDPLPDHLVRFDPLPTNADYGPEEMERVYALNRLASLGLAAGPLPPKPTFRLALELAGQAGRERLGPVAVGMLVGIESTPSPTTARWLSRGTLQARAVVFGVDPAESDAEALPEAGLSLRAGAALEPIGANSWSRLDVGGQISGEGGAGWYVRGEWRQLFADVSSRGWSPDRVEVGLQLDWLFGRVGPIGN